MKILSSQLELASQHQTSEASFSIQSLTPAGQTGATDLEAFRSLMRQFDAAAATDNGRTALGTSGSQPANGAKERTNSAAAAILSALTNGTSTSGQTGTQTPGLEKASYTPSSSSTSASQLDMDAALSKLFSDILAALQNLLMRAMGNDQGADGNTAASVDDVLSLLHKGGGSATSTGNTSPSLPTLAAQPLDNWRQTTLTLSHQEEKCSFACAGQVSTADGQTIGFQMDWQLAQSSTTLTASQTTVDPRALRDPLVINFDGKAAELSGKTISFQLDASGPSSQLPLLEGARGYLAFDRNGDGKITQGSELFGPASGNGFSDLASLDSDHNGWIDEGDAQFKDLSIWRPTADGLGSLESLNQAGVGAIALQSTETPFGLGDSGVLRRSGVWLSENGQVGSIQQVDVAA